MKVRTSIRVLSEVYRLFKDAGIGGLMTGEMAEVPLAAVMDKLIVGGGLVETMKVITGSEKYEDGEGIETEWEDVPYSVINGVLQDFFAGIGSVSSLALK